LWTLNIVRVLISILLTCSSFLCMGAPESFIVAAESTASYNSFSTATDILPNETKLDFQVQYFWLDEGRQIPQKTLFMQLPDKQLKLTRQRYFINSSGKLVWLGSIEGYANSMAGFTLSDKGLSGSISYDGKLLQLVRDNKGQLWLKDRSAEVANSPEDDVFTSTTLSKVTRAQGGNMQLLPQANGTQPSGFTNDQNISLLIYYPTTALETFPSLLDLIELDVAQANQAFENNQLATRLVINKILPLDIRDTDDALNQMQGRSGPFANMESVRQKYAADFVHFYVPDIISIGGRRAYCGVANYAAFPEGSVSSLSAVGVTSINCAGGLTFVHEIGHNMGARHDRFEQNGGDSRQSNYGYLNLQQGVRTIMSYPDGCSDNQIACQQIPYFSTPILTPDGNTIGIAAGEPESADNAAMLALSGYSLANLIGPQRPLGLEASNGDDSNSINLSWPEYLGADRYQLIRLTTVKGGDGSIRCLPGFIAIYKSFEVATNYYQDQDVEPKNQYCYWLQAINDKLLPGAQGSPESFAESGYSGPDAGVKIGKIADQIISDSDEVIEIPLPLSASLGDSKVDFLLEQHSFSSPPDIELVYDLQGAPSLLFTNHQRLNGNGRIIVWTTNNAEVFNFSYTGFESPLPVISHVDNQTIDQQGSLVLEFNVANAFAEYSTPIQVYSDNHEIVNPQQLQLESIDAEGNYRLSIVRDTLRSGSTLISLVAGNSEESVTESFMLTYERRLSRAPIVQDVTMYLSSKGDVSRKLPVFDPDLDTLEYVISKQPTQGTLTLRKGGEFIYEAGEQFTQDSFEFYALDPISGESDVAKVSLKRYEDRLLSPMQKMTAMQGNVMLLTHEGKVWSWGSNEFNTAGLGRERAPDWTPQLSPITDIADMASAAFTYYLKQDGSLWFMGQVYDQTDWIYVDQLSAVNEDKDWRKIECHAGQCLLLKDDGSVWTMEMVVSDNLAGEPPQISQIQHYFAQHNSLYHWQDIALNSNGGVLQNSEGKLWSWVAEGQQPQGREFEVANFAQINVPQGAAKLSLGSETGILRFGDSTLGWGRGLANLTGQQEEYLLPEIVDSSAWQSVSSDNTVFAKISQGRLATWASGSKGFSILAHMARSENPAPEVTEVDGQSDWLEVFMPGNDLLFAIKQDGSLWSAGAVFGPAGDKPPYYYVWKGGPELGVGEIEQPLYQLTQLTDFPLGKLGTADSDNDGILDYKDLDDDNDGILDVDDPFPLDPASPVVKPPVIKKGGSLFYLIGLMLIVMANRTVYILWFGKKHNCKA
jgi:alpha-tubulin suppressor-like RCC1 family protein